MLSRNNQALAAWGEGNNPNAQLFGASIGLTKSLRDKTVYFDTDRTGGEIDDRAYRIDGQRPLV
jgi:hypothetical protein